MNNNPIIVALNKLIGDKSKVYIAARAGLPVGNHSIDCNVHITGSINVGVDYDTAPTVSIPILETLALMVRYCGVTREAAKGLLTRVLSDAIAEDGKGKDALAEALPWVTEMVEEIKRDIVSVLPRQPRKGQVTTKLAWSTVPTVETVGA